MLTELARDERNSLVRLKRRLRESQSRQLLKNGSLHSLASNRTDKKSAVTQKTAKYNSDASHSLTPNNKSPQTHDRRASGLEPGAFEEKSPLRKPRITALRAHGGVARDSHELGAESELPSPFGVPEALRQNKYPRGGSTPPQGSG